jgi:hypothetical protein
MCTATWRFCDGGYDLLFSRDESSARGRGTAPSRLALTNVVAIAPSDPDSGGTWIGVNHLGLSLCVQNRYQDSRLTTPASGTISRGLLLRSLLDAPTADDALHRVSVAALDAYRPFDLALFEPSGRALMVCWSGRRLWRRALDSGDRPLVSSSFRLPEVKQARGHTYDEIVGRSGEPDLERLLSFHRSHLPERGPLSACMHRRDASTVSFSWITVGSESISFRYSDGPPCTTWPPMATPHIPRVS